MFSGFAKKIERAIRQCEPHRKAFPKNFTQKSLAWIRTRPAGSDKNYTLINIYRIQLACHSAPIRSCTNWRGCRTQVHYSTQSLCFCYRCVLWAYQGLIMFWGMTTLVFFLLITQVVSQMCHQQSKFSYLIIGWNLQRTENVWQTKEMQRAKENLWNDTMNGKDTTNQRNATNRKGETKNNEQWTKKCNKRKRCNKKKRCFTGKDATNRKVSVHRKDVTNRKMQLREKI